MTRFAEGPAASPGFLLWHATLRWQREVAAALRPLGLTHVQFVLLACAWWLAEHGEAPNQLALSRQAGTDARMTSEVVRRLEAKGLVTRAVDAEDTRARRVVPTDAGRALARRAVTAVEDADAAFFGEAAGEATPLLQRLSGIAPPGDTAAAA